MGNNTTDKKETINKNLDQILQIYDQVNETQRYEGSGIWSRFNIIVSLNIVLIGVLTFVITTSLSTARILFIVVSVAGSLFYLWAVYVLRRLWLWQSHWKQTLKNTELDIPNSLPRPFSSRPEKLKKVQYSIKVGFCHTLNHFYIFCFSCGLF